MKQACILVLSSVLLFGCQSQPQAVSTYAPPSHKNLPKAASINAQLGLAYMQRGNNRRAKQKLVIALKQDPKSATVNDSMAYYLEMTGSVAEADAYYRRALKLASGKGAPLNNYGAYL